MTKVFISNGFDAINAKAHRKEKHFHSEYALLSIVKGEIKVSALVRIYRTASTCYACVWIGISGLRNITGSAKAGGGGYDKEEDAVKTAFIQAGVHISDMSSHHSPRDILGALAVWLQLENHYIHYSHA